MSRQTTISAEWQPLLRALGGISSLVQQLDMKQSTFYRATRGQVGFPPEKRDAVALLCELHGVANPLLHAPSPWARDLTSLRLLADAMARGFPAGEQTLERLRKAYPEAQLAKLAESPNTPEAIRRAANLVRGVADAPNPVSSELPEPPAATAEVPPTDGLAWGAVARESGAREAALELLVFLDPLLEDLPAAREPIVSEVRRASLAVLTSLAEASVCTSPPPRRRALRRAQRATAQCQALFEVIVRLRLIERPQASVGESMLVDLASCVEDEALDSCPP